MQLGPLHTADQRSAEILGAVRQAFVAKGFDGASMQDLARAAGMSVGNFYRYFPSKTAIIAGLIERDMDEIQRAFQAILDAPQPMAALREVLLHRMAEAQKHDSALWDEIEAAARRNPEIGAAAQGMEAAVRQCLISVFAAETGLTRAEAARRFDTHAAFVLLLFKSAACLACPGQADSDDLKAMIVRTMFQTLDDVSQSVPKA